MPGYLVELISRDIHKPIVEGTLTGPFKKIDSYWQSPVHKKEIFHEAAIEIELMYKCQFAFTDHPASRVILSCISKHLIHHSKEIILSDTEILFCLGQATDQLNYVIGNEFILDASVNTAAALPRRIPPPF